MFLIWLKQNFQQWLHLKMAPFEEESLKNAFNEIRQNGCCYDVVYPKNGMTHLSLIVRNSYEGVHSGQIAFPRKRKQR
jgi:hypothetical protein